MREARRSFIRTLAMCGRTQAFAQIDFDGNGFIGVSELRYLLTVLGEV